MNTKRGRQRQPLGLGEGHFTHEIESLVAIMLKK